ncbi:MAG: exodeoxyribonuclease VII large subunit [Clostridia bacterium]|nr:exodeoxyribonuclease VII large subunit [Clostridia bacterium]
MTQAYTLTVSKFNEIIKNIFNSEQLLHNIKLVGEVFGISLSKSAVYFSIKDEESSLPCVCFYSDIFKNVQEGDLVYVTGSPNFYAKSGRFNFVVNKVEPFGLGLLFQRFLELKEKLQKEGLFDEKHKKAMPQNIKRIGVVTSKDGAVIQDIKNVAWRRNRAVDIVLYDCKVQGNDAEKEIAEGIKFFSNYDNVDVVVVARGGGSLEDLSAYNTELVARATFDCNKPIVSAVGHETDFTIIDFVSDLRAPTPSAAAELLTKDAKESFAMLKKDISKISMLAENFVADTSMRFNIAKNSFISLAEDFLSQKKIELEKKVAKISNKLEKFVVENDYDFKLKLAHLNKLNPLDILSLGYAKIEQNEKPVGKMKDINLNESITVYFADGNLSAMPTKEEK